MNYSKSLLAIALLAATGAAQAELGASLGVASNYYFRGISQTGDAAAVSGAIDYSGDSGLYAGTWASNVDFSSSGDTNGDGDADPVDSKADVEIDFYAGFGSDIGDSGLSYDLGGIYYYYPGAGGDDQGGDLDYGELYAGLGWGPLNGSVAWTVWAEQSGSNVAPFQEDDLYYKLSLDLPFEYQGFTSSAFVGYYDFDKDGDNGADFNYVHWGIGISKDAGDFGSVSFNYEQVDDKNDVNPDDNPNFWIGWAKDF
jgi:uncharacterized protein (TIGR02001 family)